MQGILGHVSLTLCKAETTLKVEQLKKQTKINSSQEDKDPASGQMPQLNGGRAGLGTRRPDVRACTPRLMEVTLPLFRTPRKWCPSLESRVFTRSIAGEARDRLTIS